MTENERIAVLEAQHKELYRQIHEMREDVKTIKKAVTSWRGVLFGVALTVSVAWAAIQGAWNFLKHKVGA